MSIKYNKFGEVVSVNGIVTGHHLGAPMQDAKPKRAEDNDVYATEMSVQTTIPNSDELLEEQPKPSGGASGWNDLTDKPFHEVETRDGTYDVINTESLPEPLQFKVDWVEEVVHFDGTASNEMSYLGEFTINIGTEYLVEYDGSYGYFTAFDNNGFATIGSPYGDISAARPFCISTSDGEVFVTFLDDSEHSLRITESVEHIKKMDAKYLPRINSESVSNEAGVMTKSDMVEFITPLNGFEVTKNTTTYADLINCKSNAVFPLLYIDGDMYMCFTFYVFLTGETSGVGQAYALNTFDGRMCSINIALSGDEVFNPVVTDTSIHYFYNAIE